MPTLTTLVWNGAFLVGEVGVERSPWTAAVFWVDVAGALGLAVGAEVLAVRR
jgi:hypothetical protein